MRSGRRIICKRLLHWIGLQLNDSYVVQFHRYYCNRLLDWHHSINNANPSGAITHNSHSGLMWNIALDGNGNPKLPGTNSCGGPGCRAIVQVNSDGTFSVNQECTSIVLIYIQFVNSGTSLLDGASLEGYSPPWCRWTLGEKDWCVSRWIKQLGTSCGGLRDRSSIVLRLVALLTRRIKLWALMNRTWSRPKLTGTEWRER